MTYGLLRHGVAVEAVKRQVLDSTDIGALPDNIQARYRELVTLADKVATVRQDAAGESRADSDSQVARQADAVGDLVKGGASLATAVASGNAPGVIQGGLSLLSVIGDTAEATQTNTRSADRVQDALRSELTDFEFSLSEWRGTLRKEYNLPKEQLVSIPDFTKYLQLGRAVDDYSSGGVDQLRVLLERNPAMYPAALDLANWTLITEQSTAKAAEYAHQALEHVPRVINRSRARASAYAILSVHAMESGNGQQANDFVQRALDENPRDRLALIAAAGIHDEQKEPEAALEYTQRLTRLYPDNARFHILTARLYAQTDDHNAAVSAIRSAMKDGYTEMPALGQQPFTRLHSLTEFQQLTQLHLTVEMNWNALTPDEVRIRNDNLFAWENVAILPVYKLRDENKPYRYTESKAGYGWDRIPAGDFVEFQAVDSTKDNVKWLKLRIRTDQGAVQFPLIYRADGSYQVGKASYQFAWK
jgi:tetratricopeptide (TPR) repeat protein